MAVWRNRSGSEPDGVVEEIAGHFPNNVSKPAQDWRIAKQKLESQGLLGIGADYSRTAVEAFTDRVSDKDVPNAEDRARALSWALDAPASALPSVHTGFEPAGPSNSRHP